MLEIFLAARRCSAPALSLCEIPANGARFYGARDAVAVRLEAPRVVALVLGASPHVYIAAPVGAQKSAPARPIVVAVARVYKRPLETAPNKIVHLSRNAKEVASV